MAQADEKKQVELNKANVQLLKLAPLDADPVDVENGDIWYVAAAVNKFRKRQNGVSKDLDAA